MLDNRLKLVIFDIKEDIKLCFEDIFKGELDIAVETCVADLKNDPLECLVVSDSKEKIKAYKSMGISCIGYIGSAQGAEDTKNTDIYSDMSDADYLIESLESIDLDFVRMVYSHTHNLPHVIAKTNRLKIREMITDDIDDLASLVSDCEFTVFSENIREEEFRSYFRAYISKVYKFYGFGLYALIDANDILVGFAGVNENAELGYVIKEDYRRKGYAKEAVEIIVKYVFVNSDFDEIIAKTDEGNEPSKALLRSVGFDLAEGERVEWKIKRKSICT